MAWLGGIADGEQVKSHFLSEFAYWVSIGFFSVTFLRSYLENSKMGFFGFDVC